uniref:Uncharacterized protein n=1 Tax=Panagrolaimus superbus TaxID=310955 RepID=A0A914YLS8_9BILA
MLYNILLIRFDTQQRIAFFSNQKNKEYIQMYVDGNIKAEHREAVVKAAETFFSFIPEFINTENLGANRPFIELEENLGDLPISLSAASLSEFPRPDVVMRSIDATSFSLVIPKICKCFTTNGS